MRKKYYCPHCGQFRSSNQIFDYYLTLFNLKQNLKCKYCCRDVIQTEPKFKMFFRKLQQ